MSEKSKNKRAKRKVLPPIHSSAAGLDVGSTFHVVAVPPERSDEHVRSFRSFTGDLQRMTDWLSTNLAFKQSATVFPGAACVVALVDRFNQHCHRVEIDADSWRDKHSFERDHEPPPAGPNRIAKRR